MKSNSSAKAKMLSKKKIAKPAASSKPVPAKKAALKNIFTSARHKVSRAINKLQSVQVSFSSASNKKPAAKAVYKNTAVSSAMKAKDVIKKVEAVLPAVETAVLERPRFVEERYNLPWRYNDDRIVLLPRDPWWIFTYWDISQKRVDQVVATIPDNERYGLRWILRVYDVTSVANFDGNNANSHFDIDIYFDATNWYLNVDKPGCSWCVEIGFLSHTGKFYMVARSNIIGTPRFGISSNIDEEWALPDEEYFKLLGIYDLGRSSMSMKKRFEEIVKKQISSQMASFNISSPVGGMKEQDQFFLEVWTELILHGRTEASAHVTVEGKKIDLRPDGTFTQRYALPVGDYKYEVTGVSKNKKHKITKTPAVKRFEK